MCESTVAMAIGVLYTLHVFSGKGARPRVGRGREGPWVVFMSFFALVCTFYILYSECALLLSLVGGSSTSVTLLFIF